MTPKKKQPTIGRFFQSISTPPESSDVSSASTTPKISDKIQQFALKRTFQQQQPIIVKQEPPRTPPKRKATTPDDIQSKPKTKRSKTLTPLEKQIIELTESNPDKILLIQVGYKYKVFGPDARKVSKILNIMYIPNGNDDPKTDGRFSYCSFPDFKLHINLKRILQHTNHKIGVVKQLESTIIKSIEKTSKSSEVMKRELVGVYTLATYMNDEFAGTEQDNMGDENENPGYIICINETEEITLAIVAVQPITGDIIYDEFKDGANRQELETRLTYLKPSEVLVVNKCQETSPSTLKILKLINNRLRITHMSDSESLPLHHQLENHLDPELVAYYSVNFSESVQSCIARLMTYLQEFKLSNIFTIPSNMTPFKNSKTYMILPANTLAALEIFTNSTNPDSEIGTLTWLLNHTRTRFGDRLFRKWISRPLINKTQIEDRLSAVEILTGDYNQIIDSLKNQLHKMGKKKIDLEELLIKVHYSASQEYSRISRRDVVVMLDYFKDILKLVKSFENGIIASKNNSIKSSKLLNEILNGLLELANEDVVTRFTNMINPSYLFNESKDIDEQKKKFFNLDNFEWEGISSEIHEIKSIETQLDQELVSIRSILNRPHLKFITNNREPYLIEVRNGKQVDELPATFQRINGTTTVSRFRSEKTCKLYKLLQYHQEMLLKNCDEAYKHFIEQLDKEYTFFRKVIKHLATFDCLLSLSAASVITKQVKPKLVDDLVVNVVKARNPIIEQLKNDAYVPNDIDIHYDHNRVLIITGPNMGGKSSYVKQVALLAIMTQIGCYIPCEAATMGIFDSIFIRMGASDDILRGQSTFMTEMTECNNIIQNLTNRSLVILDEIGRGTGTIDGISLAYSILKYLIESDHKPLLLFITHYPSIHVLEHEYPGQVVNYHMGFKEIKKSGQEFPEIIFLYNLCRGVINNSYGLNVAKLAGIPNSIISQAFKTSEDMKNRIELGDHMKLLDELVVALRNSDEGLGERIFKYID
ncbi:MSH3 [[Candida] subhashii]|uniref:DNA mismatch repair protein MSH3 n=1 Tax=[Candida] subhashii TaxID=561895 RepID=A0A8J5UJC4_9ASCO|nr:MSH3 [[Candida] subhashii]KAG7661667.1 MSH3 [[Candida] subhashii]